MKEIHLVTNLKSLYGETIKNLTTTEILTITEAVNSTNTLTEITAIITIIKTEITETTIAGTTIAGTTIAETVITETMITETMITLHATMTKVVEMIKGETIIKEMDICFLLIQTQIRQHKIWIIE